MAIWISLSCSFLLVAVICSDTCFHSCFHIKSCVQFRWLTVVEYQMINTSIIEMVHGHLPLKGRS